MRGKLVHELQLLVRVRVWGWVRVMVEFGTSSAFRGWVRVRVLGYGFGVRGRKVKSRDCALASDLVRATTCLVLTHAARAARLLQPSSVAARDGWFWSEQLRASLQVATDIFV